MIIQTHKFNLLVQCRQGITIAFRLHLPLSLIPDLNLALHLAWVLTPYLGELQTHKFLVRFGYFLVPDNDGYWKDALPDIELL